MKMNLCTVWRSFAFLFVACSFTIAAAEESKELEWNLRYQVRYSTDLEVYRTLTRAEKWQGRQTAVIVCDMWDAHHCLNAVRRATEMAPRMNEFINVARDSGALIIHAPSSCTKSYEEHPARIRAKNAPKADNVPVDISQWCKWIPAEDQKRYPIDQSDGGEDDDPDEHKKWAEELKAKGLNPRAPWTKQMAALEIKDSDAISDNGVEIWNLMESKGIENVILVGVHTNMCVLGRPFGLRQMAKNGKNVVLVRDLTDTMYNPQRAPYVSHFSGTDLIVEHVERYVCPTVTSDQLLGDKEFRFSTDKRPHIVCIMAEQEYETKTTLNKYAREFLQKDYRLSFVYENPENRDDIPGLEILHDADLAIISVRRRAIPSKQLAHVRDFVAAGKPMIGIRTSSHAFSLRTERPQAGHDVWPEFDRDVWGGNYHNHLGNNKVAHVWTEKRQAAHPILAGIETKKWESGGSLYMNAPLVKGTTTLISGNVDGVETDEPVAWTYQHVGKGRAFYTSLGHVKDFANPDFQRLLQNAVVWALHD
jgi:type 1 glutamine amidotransferase/nicotinamidase-related amidase